MATIIAGRFEQQSQVQEAMAELLNVGFQEDHISSFYVNPPGRHDLYPIGGDRQESPGAEHNTTERAAGIAAGSAVGATVGLTAAPLVGPIGPITGALVGAHVGSLVGNLSGMDDDGSAVEKGQVAARPPGMLVAVSVSGPTDETVAIDLLRELGANDIERNSGTIVDGDWRDFDPLQPPPLVEKDRPPSPAPDQRSPD